MLKREVHIFDGKFRLNPQLCNQIIEVGTQSPEVKGTVFSHNRKVEKQTFRRSEVRWVQASNTQITKLVWDYFNYANNENFGFDIDTLRSVQFTTYRAENEGHYNWHQDCYLDSDIPKQRKLSLVIQLSKSSDYEGGDFIFSPNLCGGWDEKKSQSIRKQGTAIVFPSYTGHRVTPVTKGVRQSLVSWVEGPHWR